MRILDALSASGLRALRFAKEVGVLYVFFYLSRFTNTKPLSSQLSSFVDFMSSVGVRLLLCNFVFQPFAFIAFHGWKGLISLEALRLFLS